MKTSLSKWYSLIGGCLMLLALAQANGVELDLTARTGLEASDNMSLSNEGGEQDVRQTVGFDLEVLETGRSIQADISLSVEHSKYYQKSYSDETSLGAGVGVLNFGLVDSFLDWRSSFRRSEVITDSSNRYNPDSREYRNIVRSGPVLNYQLSRAAALEFSSSYVGVENSDPDVSDSERVDNFLGLSYDINPLTELSLNGSYANVIDGDELDTFEDASVNVGLVRQFVRGQLSINIGRTRFIPETGDQREGNFFDIGFNREQLFLHDWTLRYNEDISDTSIGFENEEDALESENTETLSINGTDILERRRFTLRVRREIGRMLYELSSRWEEEDYLVQLSDQRTHRADAQLRSRISPVLTFGAAYSWQSDNFIDVPSTGKDITSSYEVNSTYLLSQDVSLDGYLRFESRINSVNDGREYEGVFIGADLSWALL